MSGEWFLIFGMALVTFLVRYPLLVIVGRVPLPDSIFRALRYVPIAVLTAICVPAVFRIDETGMLDVPALVGGVVSALIAWRTKNLLLTIVIGMSVYLLLRSVL